MSVALSRHCKCHLFVIIVQKQSLELVCKKYAPKNFAKFTSKRICGNLVFNKVGGVRPATLLKDRTRLPVNRCEFCEILKNTYCSRMTPVAASDFINILFCVPFKRFQSCFHR